MKAAVQPVPSTYPGGKRASGDFQQIMNEIPFDVDRIIVGFLGNCPIFEWFLKNHRRSTAFEIDHEVISAYWRSIERVNLVRQSESSILAADIVPWLEMYGPSIPTSVWLYLDPPYLPSTLKSKSQRYLHKFGRESHKRLLDIITKLKCRVAISGYSSEMYNSMLKDWQLKRWDSSTRSGRSVESLWMSYSPPEKLFTYDFLGTDRTDRQRIKRKIHRWQTKISALEPRERNTLLHSLRQLKITE